MGNASKAVARKLMRWTVKLGRSDPVASSGEGLDERWVGYSQICRFLRALLATFLCFEGITHNW